MMMLSPCVNNSEASIEKFNCSLSANDLCNNNPDKDIKVYKRRFWMLILYFVSSILGNMYFGQYTTEANVTACYYGVSQTAVTWTGLIALVVYIVLIIPASSLINILDLRRTMIVGSALNTLACALQFFTLKPDGFLFVMLSCLSSALSCLFLLGLTPYLVARWFPSREVSRACAFGVMGIELGVTIGVIFTPLLVDSDCEKKDLIEEGKRNVAYILTILNATVLIVTCFTFQNTPQFPPSIAQIEKSKDFSSGYSLKSMLKMMKNRDFLLLFLLIGLMAGAFLTFPTIANNLMIRFFPNKEVEISWMSTFFCFMGVIGEIVAGYIMDCTHKFKEITIVFSMMSLVFYILFSCLLYLKILWVQFILVGGYGFFLGGFLPVGLEYAMEIIFPASEILSSNLQFLSTQAFGLIVISIISNLLYSYGPVVSNSAVAVDLLLCCIVSCFLTRDYKRFKVNSSSTEHPYSL